MTVHSPTWEKASARVARAEPSMVQAAHTTANQHAESTDHNIHSKGRSDPRPQCYKTTTRSEALHGVMALNFGQRHRQREENSPSRLATVDSNSTTTNGLEARTITNLQIPTLMKVDRSHQKLRNGKTDRMAKTLENVYHRSQHWKLHFKSTSI